MASSAIFACCLVSFSCCLIARSKPVGVNGVGAAGTATSCADGAQGTPLELEAEVDAVSGIALPTSSIPYTGTARVGYYASPALSLYFEVGASFLGTHNRVEIWSMGNTAASRSTSHETARVHHLWNAQDLTTHAPYRVVDRCLTSVLRLGHDAASPESLH